MQTDVLVVGGGLSGLHSALLLHQNKVPFLLAEARDRFGGRIFSRNAAATQPDAARDAEPAAATAKDYDASLPGFDLGPAWFWPGQSNILSLLQELGLAAQVFEQASAGAALYEEASGRLRRGIQGLSMAGSFRLRGGIRQIIAELLTRLPAEALHAGLRIREVRRDGDALQVEATLAGEPAEIRCQQLMFALPPRLVVDSIGFSPALSPERSAAFAAIPTWMAGHAKVVNFYARPFWREAGLSGDAMSQRGPMHEIHDASPEHGGPYALFGFVGVPAEVRRDRETEVRAAATAQLVRLFGEAAASPQLQYYKDWASDPFTATAADQPMMTHHASHDLKVFSEPGWGQRLWWSGSETASCDTRNNGYIEGAVEASARTVAALLKARAVL